MRDRVLEALRRKDSVSVDELVIREYVGSGIVGAMAEALDTERRAKADGLAPSRG